MGSDHLSVGHTGEEMAAGFLARQGMVILERNFSTAMAEIDIIAKDGSHLRFVEVKTRSRAGKASPGQAVDRAKQKKIIRGAQQYIKMKQLKAPRLCFDVIEIILSQPEPIRYIPNAFGA